MDLNCEYFDYKKDLNKQRELFADAFAEVQDSTLDSYYWLLHQYPNTKASSFEYCAFIEDEMVGYYAAVPYQYKIMGKVTDVGMVCGVMTSSKHRGKGIFTKLGHYSTTDLATHVPFTTGYPIRDAVIPGHLKVGWKIAFDLPLYMKFLKTDALLKNKGIPFVSKIINPLLSTYNYFRKTSSKGKYIASVYRNITSISGYDEFVKAWGNTVPNALVKNMNFAKWRFGRPGVEYRYLVISENNKIIAYSAFRNILKEGVPSLCLLDMMVLPEHSDCLGFLFKNLVDIAKSDGSEAIMFMMSKYSSKKYKVIPNGFFRSPYKFQLIIKNLTNQFTNEDLMEEKNWHLMWVDSDDL